MFLFCSENRAPPAWPRPCAADASRRAKRA